MKGTALTFFPLSLAALVGGLGVAAIVGSYSHHFLLSALFASFSAFLISCLFKLPSAWRLFCALAPLASALAISREIPTWLLASAFLVSALLYFPTLWTRVPFYPTALPMYDQVAKLLPGEREFRFIDLGCGFATLAYSLARRFPKGQFYGAEISPLALLVGFARSVVQKNLHVRASNFWKSDLGNYDVVYAFLAPPPMPKLWEKVKAEMKPGSLFIVNAFPVPGVAATETHEVADRGRQKLFIYRI